LRIQQRASMWSCAKADKVKDKKSIKSLKKYISS